MHIEEIMVGRIDGASFTIQQLFNLNGQPSAFAILVRIPNTRSRLHFFCQISPDEAIKNRCVPYFWIFFSLISFVFIIIFFPSFLLLRFIFFFISFLCFFSLLTFLEYFVATRESMINNISHADKRLALTLQ